MTPVAEVGVISIAERVAALPARQRAELLLRLRQQRRPVAAAPSDPWVLRYRRNPDAALRLFCFPYAGGGASVYRAWGADLPSDVEVCAIQLPGRESRIGQPAYRRITPLVTDLAATITPYLDRPFAFFGHSMGALVAFELARHLRRASMPQPTRVSLAAFRAPQLPNPNIRIHHLPDEVFTVVLRGEGVPEAVLQNTELMRAMLPTLRADFEACDTYDYTEEAPLPSPLSIFGGQDDVRVGATDLAGWQRHAGTTWRLTMLPGSHFFVHTAHDLLLAAVRRDMARDTQLLGDEPDV